MYGDSGTFNVSVTATDSDGGRRTVNSSVVVAPLVAVGTASPSTAPFGASILFTVTVSTGALIDHYEWDFGEGQIISTPANSLPHVFQSKGTKTVVVRVVPVVGPAKTVFIQVEIT
jgi:PKD repeat protein